MLSRIFEWYRVVDAQPTSQTIDRRSTAAHGIVEAIDKAEDMNLGLEIAKGVVAGFDTNFTQESAAVTTVLAAIRSHESAFPADLSENALELRVCAAVAIGEIISRNADTTPTKSALALAAVLRSGLGAKVSPDGRFLRQMLDEIRSASKDILARGASLRRESTLSIVRHLDGIKEVPDPSAMIKAVVAALKGALTDADKRSEIDREELDVLWWMFGGTSTSTGLPLVEMPLGAAVLCCGVEIGDRCLVPPVSSLEEILRRACENGRKISSLKPRTIEEVAIDWNGNLPGVVVPSDGIRALARKYPELFPASWLCDRLVTTSFAAGWASDFERLTGVQLSHRLTPADWGVQIFVERIAYRLIAA